MTRAVDGKRTILIIEDDEVLLKQIVLQCELMGCWDRILRSLDGLVGYGMIDEADAVVSDYSKMPIDAIQDKCKQDNRPLIVYTGDAGVSLRYGRLLGKPSSGRDLRDSIIKECNECHLNLFVENSQKQGIS